MLFEIAGQEAEEDMGAYPPFVAVADRADADLQARFDYDWLRFKRYLGNVGLYQGSLILTP